MKRFTIVLIAALAICANAGAQVPPDWDWAQFYRYAESNAALTCSPKAVFMGDSITDNWAAYDPGFFAEHNFAGRGISGQTTSHMLVRFWADVIDLKPKYVVILAGTNDLALNNGVMAYENIMDNLTSMCELARKHRIKPILCSVTPSVQFGWRPYVDAIGEIPVLNGMIEDYAKSARIPYVDYYSLLVDERHGLAPEYLGDETHPSLGGYKVMEELILKYLK